MNKAAGIEFLRERLNAIEGDRKNLHAQLSQLDDEVQAIKLLLAKYAGIAPSLPLSYHADQSIDPIDAVSSVSALAAKALAEAGKPQKTAQILAFLAKHGKSTSSATLRSTIHQKAEMGKLFKVLEPGVFGLMEWSQTR